MTTAWIVFTKNGAIYGELLQFTVGHLPSTVVNLTYGTTK
jgi:hypothetical protein